MIRETILAIAIHRDSDSPIFGEGVINVRIEDDAAGWFIVLEQDENKITINPDELQPLVDVARRLLAQKHGPVAADGKPLCKCKNAVRVIEECEDNRCATCGMALA